METMDLDLYLEYKSTKIRVIKRMIKFTEIYGIVFADKRPPLMITVGSRKNGKAFWTSIPEGRQQEAEDIGALIDNHFNLF